MENRTFDDYLDEDDDPYDCKFEHDSEDYSNPYDHGHYYLNDEEG